MKINSILKVSSVKILLYLLEREKARYSELLDKAVLSRSTLSLALKHLLEEELIEREVKDTKPIQTIYTLTDVGRNIAKYFKFIEDQIFQLYKIDKG